MIHSENIYEKGSCFLIGYAFLKIGLLIIKLRKKTFIPLKINETLIF